MNEKFLKPKSMCDIKKNNLIIKNISQGFDGKISVVIKEVL